MNKRIIKISILCATCIILINILSRTLILPGIQQFSGEYNSMRNITVCEHKTPTFLKETRPLVALASFEGSGNSWTRQVLESSTGIYTGSLYLDKLSSFEGSKRCPAYGGVFIVKTHHANTSDYSKDKQCKTRTIFARAIFILRNPFDAMIATFNKAKGGKVGFAQQEDFATVGFRGYVRIMSVKWRKMVLFWLTEFDRPLHVMVYEDLQANTVKETQKMLQFLEYPVDYKTLACLKKDNSTEKYYRAKKADWLTKENLFPGKLKQIVNREITDVSRSVKPYLSMVIENYILK